MEWTSEAATKAFFKRIIHWNEGMHHQEYIRAKWNAMEYPIHVFIVSKQAVQGSLSQGGPNKLKKHQHPMAATMNLPFPSPISSTSQSTLMETSSRISDRSLERQTTIKPQAIQSGIEDQANERHAARQPVSSTQPVSALPRRPEPSRDASRNETSSDLGSDDENPTSERNGWKWDKKFKLWRRHIYTDGELDYTTWSRSPEVSDS